jgi:hypothetical protein
MGIPIPVPRIAGRATYHVLAVSHREQISKHCSLEPRGDFKAEGILMVPPNCLGGWSMGEYGKKISEYGENSGCELRPICGTCRHLPAVTTDFGDAALGEANQHTNVCARRLQGSAAQAHSCIRYCCDISDDSVHSGREVDILSMSRKRAADGRLAAAPVKSCATDWRGVRRVISSSRGAIREAFELAAHANALAEAAAGTGGPGP